MSELSKYADQLKKDLLQDAVQEQAHLDRVQAGEPSVRPTPRVKLPTKSDLTPQTRNVLSVNAVSSLTFDGYNDNLLKAYKHEIPKGGAETIADVHAITKATAEMDHFCRMIIDKLNKNDSNYVHYFEDVKRFHLQMHKTSLVMLMSKPGYGIDIAQPTASVLAALDRLGLQGMKEDFELIKISLDDLDKDARSRYFTRFEQQSKDFKLLIDDLLRPHRKVETPNFNQEN